MARRPRRLQTDHRAGHRTSRVAELIRRIVASELEDLEDERLEFVSIIGVDIDRDLDRAVIWFSTLEGDDEPETAVALAEHKSRLRRAVGAQARLRKTPDLQFRPDEALRSAQRIEELLESARRTPGSEPVAGSQQE